MIFSGSASKEVIFLCVRVRLSHLLEHGLDVCGTDIFSLTTEIGMNISVAAGALQSACRILERRTYQCEVLYAFLVRVLAISASKDPI